MAKTNTITHFVENHFMEKLIKVETANNIFYLWFQNPQGLQAPPEVLGNESTD
jgi:hypothetical protein